MRPYADSKNDAYAIQQARQNQNLPCEHCHSTQGHLATCPLLNRGVAEVIAAISFVAVKYSEAQQIIAHALGVKLS
jgi:hypothetical protein